MGDLELRGITKSYASGANALDAVDLEVHDGEMMVLVGPSGCGKSTLLRIVAGLLQPTAGEVRIGGRVVNDLEPGSRDVALVFQNYALYPHMTVRNNLAFPLRMQGTPRRERRARVEAVADQLGLGALLERKPAQLSGGQMQRVALGRALVRRPRVFLFDEPLSNLDARLRADMRAEIRRLHGELGITSLYVTHDQAEAMTIGQRVCVLDGGRVSQVGPPLELHAHPTTRFVADFLGSPGMNLVEVTVSGGRVELCGTSLAGPSGVADGIRVTLGIRPQDLALTESQSGSPSGAKAVVVDVERRGSTTLCVVAGPGGERLTMLQRGDADPTLGVELELALGTAPMHWFGADGRRLDP